MNRILSFEWARLRGRRDLYFILAGFALLVLLREAIALRDISSLLNDPGIPLEAAEAQRQALAAYSASASIGTVVINSAILLFLLSGFLTCWTLGGEFTSGTVRTALMSDPRRPRYILGRLVGAAALAVVVVLVSAAVGATMPAVALSLAVDVGESAPTLQVLLFLGAAVLVALFAVSLAGVLTSTIRSPLLSSGAFLGAVSFGQLLDQPTLPVNIRNLLPMRAISMILESSAPTGAMIARLTARPLNMSPIHDPKLWSVRSN